MESKHDNAYLSVPAENRSTANSPFWRAFKKSGFHCFVFLVFLILLSWPVLSIAGGSRPYWSILVYLFSVWLFLIIVLVLVAHSIRRFHPLVRQTQNRKSPS